MSECCSALADALARSENREGSRGEPVSSGLFFPGALRLFPAPGSGGGKPCSTLSALLDPVGGLVWVGGVCCICLHVIYFPTSDAARSAHAKWIDSLHSQQVLLLVPRPLACFLVLLSCCFHPCLPLHSFRFSTG